MHEISVGDVLRALEGSLDPVECSGLSAEEGCSASGKIALPNMYGKRLMTVSSDGRQYYVKINL